MSVFTNSSVVKTQIEAFRGAQGPQGIQGIQGIQGPQGAAGRDGVSPTITLTREADGVVITTTDASGTHSEKVYDGQGSSTPGVAGENGGYYAPSVDSAGNLTWTASKADMPAVSGVNIKGPAGTDGKDGAQGAQGPAGADGKTPVKGTDYWTEEDKTEIVSDVLAALPNASGVNF